jgi:hypothetical protein
MSRCSFCDWIRSDSSRAGLYVANAFFLAAFTLLVGCTRYSYDIEMQPVGEKLERRLTFKVVTPSSFTTDDRGTSKSKESDSLHSELERIARAYGASPPKGPTTRESFKGTFSGQLPQDVGGAGEFIRYESPFGSAVVYAERFRGNDDLHGQLEIRRKAVDQLSDLLVGWFQSELRDAPGWPALRGFLDKTLRTDLHNLSLFGWAYTAFADEKREQLNAEIGLRAMQYLVERGYVSYEEIPRLAVALRGEDQVVLKTLLARLRALLISRAEIRPNALPADKLAFLSNWERLTISWQTYFKQSDYFKSRKDEYLKQIDQDEKLQAKKDVEFDKAFPEEARKMAKARSDQSRTSAAEFAKRRSEVDQEVFIKLLATAFVPYMVNFLESGDRLNVRLAAPHAPKWTNGKWKADERQVVWSGPLPALSTRLSPFNWPTFCFAVWDEPKDASQRRLFGKVAMEGDTLFQYCIWYQGLTVPERQQWDAFVATLKPDNESRERLKRFRFAEDRAVTDESNSRAADGINALTHALNASHSG